MRTTDVKKIGLSVLALIGFHFLSLSSVHSEDETLNGVQPLIEQGRDDIHELIPPSVQPLISAQELEQFLEQLEDSPPDWSKLRHKDMTEQSERLFQLNRQRDSARTNKTTLLQQPVAFQWTGLLRQYVPEFQGFSLAIGPEHTQTSWGILRFKPSNLPDYLIAIPPQTLRKHLLTRQKHGERIEIIILCIGILTDEESIIYAFSHDGNQDGMLLPVVSIQKMIYILKPG